MDGISWAILACIASFVYRQYTRDPRGFIAAWSDLMTNVRGLFISGGQGRDSDDGSSVGNPDILRTGSWIPKRERANSTVVGDPESLSALASPRRKRRGQQDGSDKASAGEQAENDSGEASLNKGGSDDSDERKGSKVSTVSMTLC